ncbi:hypothetical protein Arad_8860 [Rhizobium rhizogenes K84]|uniref:Uncharacterized protein n=1 Tax=Rhizobium rhizogenes (strain K84 / ATCC BAA-868) TaxID=311403 RepID=B9JJD8_RHIR8|nr:hypothetical protein Arad_8860 [Rhizobium rhizogenes K84]
MLTAPYLIRSLKAGCSVHKYRIFFAFYEVEIYVASNFSEPDLRISSDVPS